MEYAIKMSPTDVIIACENFLRDRRHKANKKRIKIINELTSPSTKTKFFFFKVEVPPECKSARDAIRYMKCTSRSYFDTTLWEYCNQHGLKWELLAKDLLTQVKTGRVTQDVELGDNMAYLATYVY